MHLTEIDVVAESGYDLVVAVETDTDGQTWHVHSSDDASPAMLDLALIYLPAAAVFQESISRYEDWALAAGPGVESIYCVRV
jgi:hypothetical protein